MGQMLSELLHSGYSSCYFLWLAVSVSALDVVYEHEQGEIQGYMLCTNHLDQ